MPFTQACVGGRKHLMILARTKSNNATGRWVTVARTCFCLPFTYFKADFTTITNDP